jgi:hypothetical protein
MLEHQLKPLGLAKKIMKHHFNKQKRGRIAALPNFKIPKT